MLKTFHARATLAAAVLALSIPAAARADGREGMPPVMPDAFLQECASCHVAYPPAMLPARSWQRIMNGLGAHYGTDASLDASTAKTLSDWLQARAGTYKRVAEEPTQDRITRSAWFERKHRRIEPSTWQLASVKSAANCAACHTGAERGQYDDDHLRFPAGLDARQRRSWND